MLLEVVLPKAVQLTCNRAQCMLPGAFKAIDRAQKSLRHFVKPFLAKTAAGSMHAGE